MADVFLIFFTAIFVNNIVLAQYLGNCPYVGCSKEGSVALGMGGAVLFVTTVATAGTWLMQAYVLTPFDLGYLQTIVFIVVIAALVQFVEMFMKKTMPPLYAALGIFLPLITTNCAVLGVVLLNIDTNGYSGDLANFGRAMVCSFGAGLGFMVAMVMFAGVRSRLEGADIPKFLRGLPITLIAASLTSLSFLGFAGLVENMFA